MSAELPPVILYHYTFSPFSRRIVWYLQLRGIPYKQCMQPPLMPRPDIASLGIQYRRIPICSIGRDVYLDTRLILQKLETLPTDAPKLGAADGTEQRAIERLLEVLNIDAGPFLWAVSLMPRDMPLFKDPKWLQDRADFLSGQKITTPSAESRSEAINNLRGVFELLETTLLADGRDWILKTERPTIADIEAVWLFHWLSKIPGALPSDQLSANHFPSVFAWIERFDKAVTTAEKKLGEVPSLTGREATGIIVTCSFFENNDRPISESDPLAQSLGLKKGDSIVVYPLDSGSTHRDSGSLHELDAREVVFETKAQVKGSPAVRVHAPRHGFRVSREDQASL